MSASMQQTLIHQPGYKLNLVKFFDSKGQPCHSFTLYPTSGSAEEAEHQRIVLLTGSGHEASRKDMHYALYLFQRFHLNSANGKRVASA